MGDCIEIPGTDARGWLSRPESGEGPGVLVLHAWWGLNDAFRAIADRLAGEGFVALAPDLYGGVTVDTIEDAESEVDSRPFEATLAIVRASATRLAGDSGEIGRAIGVVGFSMGAFWALELAAARPAEPVIDAVGLVYGTGRTHDWRDVDTAFQGHYAGDDPYEAPEDVDALEAALRAASGSVTFHRYPGAGHWFMEPDRPDAFDQVAAEEAWRRLVGFLRENLGPIGS